MQTTVPLAQRRAVKQHLLADLQEGYSVQQTQARAVIPFHQATIYRLRQRFQADPATALDDGRHGHPIKLRGEARDWLMAFCQEAPRTPSHRARGGGTFNTAPHEGSCSVAVIL